MPHETFDSELETAIQQVTNRFLKFQEGTPVHTLKAKLGKKHSLLEIAVRNRYLQEIGPKYFPCFLAVELEDKSNRLLAEHCTTLVLKTLKAIYIQNGDRMCSAENVFEAAQSVDFGATPEYVSVGMLFAVDFPIYIAVWNASPSNEKLSLSLPASAQLLDFEDLAEAWKQEVDRRNTMPANFTGPLPAQQIPTLNKPEAVNHKRRRVFIIHGRDEALRNGIFTFLRALALEPIEWTKAIQLTGKGSPFIGEILEAAFNHAQAAVVLLSPDDEARLRADLIRPDDPFIEKSLNGQARPNVLFEAGMAFGSHPDQTVLVQFGEVRPFSDVAGRHVVKMDDSIQKRQDLALRLRTAGCLVDMDGTDWHKSGNLTTPNKNTVTLQSQVDRPKKRTRIDPRIEFSHVPVAGGGPDSRGTFKGIVIGVPSPERYKIVLFALTDKWYVQPLRSNPYTSINAEGNWENWTHLGARYAALLVRESFTPSPMEDTLPDIGGDILAKSEVPPYGGPYPIP